MSFAPFSTHFSRLNMYQTGPRLVSRGTGGAPMEGNSQQPSIPMQPLPPASSTTADSAMILRPQARAAANETSRQPSCSDQFNGILSDLTGAGKGLIGLLAMAWSHIGVFLRKRVQHTTASIVVHLVVAPVSLGTSGALGWLTHERFTKHKDWLEWPLLSAAAFTFVLALAMINDLLFYDALSQDRRTSITSDTSHRNDPEHSSPGLGLSPISEDLTPAPSQPSIQPQGDRAEPNAQQGEEPPRDWYVQFVRNLPNFPDLALNESVPQPEPPIAAEAQQEREFQERLGALIAGAVQARNPFRPNFDRPSPDFDNFQTPNVGQTQGSSSAYSGDDDMTYQNFSFPHPSSSGTVVRARPSTPRTSVSGSRFREEFDLDIANSTIGQAVTTEGPSAPQNASTTDTGPPTQAPVATGVEGTNIEEAESSVKRSRAPRRRKHRIPKSALLTVACVSSMIGTTSCQAYFNSYANTFDVVIQGQGFAGSGFGAMMQRPMDITNTCGRVPVDGRPKIEKILQLWPTLYPTITSECNLNFHPGDSKELFARIPVGSIPSATRRPKSK